VPSHDAQGRNSKAMSDIDGSDNIQSSNQSRVKQSIKASQKDQAEQIDHYNHMMSPKGINIQSNSEMASIKQDQNCKTGFIKV
tara:strand:+ start:279 stop:527 length:249 start_codon:yes stop_codon:yes gene_type:complete